MKQEAFKIIATNRGARFSTLNKFGAVDMSSVFSEAANLSEQDRMAYIKNFISEHGLRGTLDLIRNLSNLFASSDPQPEATDQMDEYEPLSVSNYIGNTKRAQMYEGFKNRDESSDGAVSNTLNKLGDWSVFITFILMLGVAGTSDYNSMVANDPSFTEEIRAFLIASGSAVMAWAFKFLSKLAKK